MAEYISDEMLEDMGLLQEPPTPTQPQSSYLSDDIVDNLFSKSPLVSRKAPQKSPTFYNNQEIQQRDNDTLAKMENDPEVIKDF